MKALNRTETRLRVLENFEVDKDLPKYEDAPEEDSNVNFSSGSFGSDQIDFESDAIMGLHGNLVNYRASKRVVPLWMWNIWYYWLPNRHKRQDKAEEKQKGKIPVQAFFYELKSNQEELEKLNEMISGYQKLIKDAQEAGQKALEERLKDQLGVVSLEAKLYSKGYTKYLTEEAVVDFCKKTERGVCADWIKNFTRKIPDDIVKQKKDIDQLRVFDNYVILHYDPEGKSSHLTKKEEEEKKKDPILFGVIEHSNKLYYIDDWEDDYCDLTLDKMALHFAYSDHKIESIEPGKVEIEDGE